MMYGKKSAKGKGMMGKKEMPKKTAKKAMPKKKAK